MTENNNKSGAQEWHKHQGEAPMTKTKGDGSASRNITRKTNHGEYKSKPQHGGGGGKGKWNDLDDGSLDYE
eukprot:CAMPEP_0116050404 /NCGR_PEP_ID=MMETSP0322-20121206/360_1 /TAXON_ID=163516 /ORGANISM="Leptocylindrus danicus var. apora, Strain B651" /LENGTH=70 /DNA_ID=CAMNT_0003532947 /DNA_START=158 /DNA_END=370 /DNA_ORIENTATION=-